MLDVAGPDRSWPSLRLVVDMIIGGICARRRRRPPFLARLRVRNGWPARIPVASVDAGRCSHQAGAGGWWPRNWCGLPLWLILALSIAAYGGFPAAWTVRDHRPSQCTLWLRHAGRYRMKVLERHGYSLEGSPRAGCARPQVGEMARAPSQLRVALDRSGEQPAAHRRRTLGAGGLATRARTSSGSDPPRTARRRRSPGAPWSRHGLDQGAWHACGCDLCAHDVSRWVPVSLLGCRGDRRCRHFVASCRLAPVGMAVGIVGLGSALLAYAFRRHEHRIGRHIGLWDVWPSVAPRTDLLPRGLARWYPPAPTDEAPRPAA